jgi:ribosomal protein S18 acetylase RimI-like enzyme
VSVPLEKRAEIRPLTLEDLPEVARIHKEAFPDAALTAMGDEAVRRQYEWYLTGPHDALCMGAWLDGRLRGFCFSGLFRGATGGFLRKNRGFLIRLAIRKPRLLINPIFRGRALMALRILNPLRKRRTPAADAPWWQMYGVQAIAVHPSCQGAGLGFDLMDHAESEAIARGVPRMILSVLPTNLKAVHFYERLGWERTDHTPWDGTMAKRFTAEEGPQ